MDQERRKVQISGKSSCMVALPKKWVREMGLRQGSEIVITRPNFKSLLVTAEVVAPSTEPHNATIEVSVRQTPESLFREIVSLYLQGYSQIHLRGGAGVLGSDKRDAVKDQVRRHLVGAEGLADSKDGLTIHVLLGHSDLSVDNALKKMLQITSSMCRDAMSALESWDKRVARAVVQREEEVGRFGLYVIRQLNMTMGRGVTREPSLEPRDLLVYIQIARALDRVASHASRMAEVLLRKDNPISTQATQKISAMNGYAAGLLEESLLSLFKRDYAGADAVVEKAKRFVQMENELVKSLEEGSIEEYYTIHILVDSQKRIAEYSRDIAEVVLDLTVDRVIRKEVAA